MRTKRNLIIKILAVILALVIPFLIVLVLKVLGVSTLENTYAFLGAAIGSALGSLLVLLSLFFLITRVHDGRQQGKAELHVMKSRLGIRREIKRDEAKAEKAKIKAEKEKLNKDLYALKKDESYTKEGKKVNKYID